MAANANHGIAVGCDGMPYNLILTLKCQGNAVAWHGHGRGTAMIFHIKKSQTTFLNHRLGNMRVVHCL